MPKGRERWPKTEVAKARLNIYIYIYINASCPKAEKGGPKPRWPKLLRCQGRATSQCVCATKCKCEICVRN